MALELFKQGNGAIFSLAMAHCLWMVLKEVEYSGGSTTVKTRGEHFVPRLLAAVPLSPLTHWKMVGVRTYEMQVSQARPRF